MKKDFVIDFELYHPFRIGQSIIDFQDVAKIELKKDTLTIHGSSQKDIQETFEEFINHSLSVPGTFGSQNALYEDSLEEIELHNVGHFRFKRFDPNTYLITNDIGSYYFISYDSFSLFIQGKFQYLPEYNDLLEKGFIKTQNYENFIGEKYRKRTSFIGLGPTLHMIVVTLRCNHKCKYCHAAVAPENALEYDMSIETAKKTVDAIMYTNSTNLTIEFQGGEALLNWEVVQYIVEYAREQGEYLKKEVVFTLVTNLTLMTEEKLKWLLDNDVNICTSLDGHEELHNASRAGYKGNSFEKVSYWIQRINEENQKKGIPKIGVLLTPIKDALPEYKKIIDAYIDLGIDGIFLRWLNPYGFAAADLKNLSYEPEEWLDFYEKSLDYILELNRQGLDFREYITNVYLMKIFMDFDPAFMDVRSPGGLAVGGVAYNYDGKVYASDESRMLGRMGIDDFFMTELKESGEETYKTMMESDVTKIAVQASTLDGLPGYNDHVYKPYLGVDILHNFKVNGSLYTPLVKDKKVQIQIGILDIIFRKIQDPEIYSIFMSWLDKR